MTTHLVEASVATICGMSANNKAITGVFLQLTPPRIIAALAAGFAFSWMREPDRFAKPVDPLDRNFEAQHKE